MVRTLLLVGWLLLAGVAPAIPVAAQTPAPDAAIAQRYAVDVIFDPEAGTLSGRMTVAWTNTTGEPQASLPFRLYPNAPYYNEGQIVIDAAQVDGDAVLVEGAADDPTVMRVPFSAPVGQGETREIDVAFTTTIPVDAQGSFGILRNNSADGSWSLVNWYPIVAGWEPGVGWNLVPAVSGVDPTFATAAAWEVTVTHPDAYTIVATGEEATRHDGDTVVTTVSLETGREFAMVALPAAGVVTEEVALDGVTVTITLPAADDVPGMREELAESASEAIPRLGAWLDAPLAGELDITTAVLDGALGVSWTGAIWMDLAQLTRDGRLDDAERESLSKVVYHEIAHQWVAMLVGADSNDHTFLTEGLAHVLAVAVERDLHGGDAAERAFLGLVAGPYLAFVKGGQDGIADTPASEQAPVVHGIISYGKGGIGFEAIRQQIGDEAFFAALTTICDTFAWGIVTPGDVLGAFETASGEDLDALWGFWFEEAGATTVEDVEAVIEGAGIRE
jgi:hypothetical protein